MAAIEVKGLEKTLKALSVIDPEAMKALRQGFDTAVKPIVTKAQKRVPDRPMRNYGQWRAWSDGRDLSWDAAAVRKGIKSQVSVTKRRAALRIVSRNAAGAIWENAGSKNALKTTRADRVNQSRAFNRIANAKGSPPRLLVGTWKEEKGIKQTYKAVGKLIADAEVRVYKAMR